MKADHNDGTNGADGINTVSNGSKILKWKQTTTEATEDTSGRGLFPMVQRYLNESRPQLHVLRPTAEKDCFQWFKDT